MGALANFEQNLGYAESLLGIATAVRSLTTKALDTTDINRAAVVMAVSALDHYVHERVRELIVSRYSAGNLPDDLMARTAVPLTTLRDAVASPGTVDWLEEAIRSSHGFRTFQNPRSISEAFGLVTRTKIWTHVGTAIGAPSADVQRDLSLVVDRRNKIAHEADLNPLTLTKWPMAEADARDALNLVARIVRALDTVT